MYQKAGMQDEVTKLEKLLCKLRKDKPHESNIPSESKYYSLDGPTASFKEDTWTCHLQMGRLNTLVINK